ncbi:hypothetical protein KJ841_02630 [Patescibacteria group bacterium]|nr:hypothetical protein [Patescibacteria group bacterium]
MKQETIKSIIFSAVIGVVFVASLFLIVQQEQALNTQLTATIAAVFPSEKILGEQITKDLTGKLTGQIGKKVLSDCLDEAYNIFEDLWNQECEKQGLEEKCDLPKDIATDLLDGYQELKQGCY